MTSSGSQLAYAAALAVACAALGCSQGSAAAPAFQAGELSEAQAPVDAGSEAGFAVCPPALDASFDDLLTRVLSTSSCGTSTAFNCHSPSGASPQGAANLLNLALVDGGQDGGLDPAAIYAEIVGTQATNISGDTKVLRVAPGDAGASMLYIKLTLTTTSNPHYGAGMPLTAPGSVCPEALDAFKTWIDQGAKNN